MALRRRGQADDEEELVRALQAEHGPALLGYVTRLTSDSQRAEDVVQETLLRAWRRAGSLEGDASSLRSWLFAVAHNLAIDEHRARAARREEAEPELPDVAVAGQLDRALEVAQITEALRSLSRDHREALVETYFRGRSVAGQLDRALEVAQITEALRSLSRDHREALVETYFRGRSVTEAAVVLDVPPGTVKSRTYYGLRALRAALEERGWGG